MGQNQIEEIKSKLDIVEVIGSYVKLIKRGRHFMACCPFHSEKTPSFTVSPELQIFKCFGCGKGGDVYGFVREFEKVEFREALEILAQRAGVKLQNDFSISKEDLEAKKNIEINYWAAKFYHYILLNHKLGEEALKYTLNRGINTNTIKQFKIGFAPGADLIFSFLTKKGYKTEEILRTGNYGNKYGRNYDRFMYRLVFPLIDHRDRIVGFSGRVLPSDKNQNSAKYINSPESIVYHKGSMVYGLNWTKNYIREKKEVIVVEGEFDMISPFQEGFRNMVAVKGTAFTIEQLKLLKRYTSNLILGFDSDFAGGAAAKRSIELAESEGFDIRVLDLEDKFKDPDEAVRGDKKYFQERLEKAESVWQFLINSAFKTFDSNTDLGRKKILEFCLPTLIKISNQVIKSDYFKQLAGMLGTNEDSIIEESKKYQVSHSTNQKFLQIQTSKKQTIDTAEKLEAKILTLMFANPDKYFDLIKKNFDFFRYIKHKKLIDRLKAKKKFNLRDFMKDMEPELRPVFEEIYLDEVNQNIDDDSRKRAIEKTMDQLKNLYLKQDLRRISVEIAQSEAENNPTKLKQLEVKYKLVLEELAKIQKQN